MNESCTSNPKSETSNWTPLQFAFSDHSQSPPYEGGDAALKAQLGWSLTPKNCSVSDHPGAISLEAAPYRACASRLEAAPYRACASRLEAAPYRACASRLEAAPYRACASRLDAAPYRACAVAPPLLRKEGIDAGLVRFPIPS